MGLDMYILEVSKPKAYSGDYLQIPVADFEDKFNDILPYCEKIFLETQFINNKQIEKDYNIPENANKVGAYYGKDEISYTYNTGEKITLSTKDYEKYFYTEPVEYYITTEEEVCYWRKHYDLQKFIYQLIENERDIQVENCGYYNLSIDMIKEINRKFDENIPEKDNLFYHEWY